MNATRLAAAVFAVLLVGAGAVTAAPVVSMQGQTAIDDIAPDDDAANELDDAGQSGAAAAEERADDDESDADENASTAANGNAAGAATAGAAGADARPDVASDRSLPEQASDTAKTVQSTVADWFASDEDATESANDDGIVVVSFFAGDDADA